MDFPSLSASAVLPIYTTSVGTLSLPLSVKQQPASQLRKETHRLNQLCLTQLLSSNADLKGICIINGRLMPQKTGTYTRSENAHISLCAPRSSTGSLSFPSKQTLCGYWLPTPFHSNIQKYPCLRPSSYSFTLLLLFPQKMAPALPCFSEEPAGKPI